MKRCVLAALILAAVNCGLASADYLVVKIDLNHILYPAPPKSTTQPGGVTPLPGQVMPGNPGYIPPPFKGGSKGGGSIGKKGAYYPPPQAYYPPPGQTGQPGTVGGQAGQTGGAAPALPVPPQLPPVYVYAYVELRSYQPATALGAEYDLRLGDQKMKVLLTDKTSYGMQTLFPAMGVKPLTTEFNTKLAKLQSELKAGVDDNKKQKLLILAEWALQRGLVKQFESCIDELKKHDEKHAVVAAVEKVKVQLKTAPKVDDGPAQSIIKDLQGEGYRSVVSEKGHYNLLTNIKSSPQADAAMKKRIAKLEDVYTTYFYWFAVKGRPLAPPEKRLVVVLVDTPPSNPVDFNVKHKAFGYAPLVGSGFTAQRDNVVFMASRRMDEAFERLVDFNQRKFDINKTNMNDLLTNLMGAIKQGAFINPQGKFTQTELEEARLTQTLALCQKAMDEENENLTLSHEGIRQLIAATGLLPRTMLTAEWARFGLASFFETSAESFYANTGGPNWNHLVNFKILRRDKKLDLKDAKEILLNVVTDHYLHQANGMVKELIVNQEDNPVIKDMAAHDLDLARATSWSLMYYLVRNREKELIRYFDEINSLPRDADFDGRVLRDCFCRAFGLMTTDSSTGRNTVNTAKFDSLAKDWLSKMDSVHLDDIPGYEETAVKLKNLANFAPKTPTSPTQPGVGQPGQSGQPGYPQPGQPGYPQQPPVVQPPVQPPPPPGVGKGQR